jgi:hypothetical protein
MRANVLQLARQRRAAHHPARAPTHALINGIQKGAETIVGGIIAVGPLFWLGLVAAYFAVRFGIIR